MSKGYFIASVDVKDPAAYAEYAKLATVAIQKFGGDPIVRGGRCEMLEGQGRARNVVIEFASFDQAKAYYHSPEYQAAKARREGAAEAVMLIVEGA